MTRTAHKKVCRTKVVGQCKGNGVKGLRWAEPLITKAQANKKFRKVVDI